MGPTISSFVRGKRNNNTSLSVKKDVHRFAQITTITCVDPRSALGPGDGASDAGGGLADQQIVRTWALNSVGLPSS